MQYWDTHKTVVNVMLSIYAFVQQGRTGMVYNVTPSAVGIIVHKIVGNRYLEKRVNIRVEHVRHSKCRDDFLKRVKENAAKKKEAKSTGQQVNVKRQPALPREARTISVANDNAVETLRPIAYDTVRIFSSSTIIVVLLLPLLILLFLSNSTFKRCRVVSLSHIVRRESFLHSPCLFYGADILQQRRAVVLLRQGRTAVQHQLFADIPVRVRTLEETLQTASTCRPRLKECRAEPIRILTGR